MKKLILALLLFTVYGTVDAQRYGEIGLFGGGSYYLGDLNPGNQFLLTKPAFGAFLRHNFNERIAVRGGFTYGTLQGDDLVSKVNPERGLNFTSHVSDISATVELNFFDYFIGSLRHFVTPYMFAGASVFMYNPKATYNGNTFVLHDINTEGQGSIFPDRKMYKRTQFAIPFGIGIKYSLNSFMGISASWTMNKTFTDYIDDVSTTYYFNTTGLSPTVISPSQLASDPTLQHEKDMQRGDPTYNDWYSFIGLSVSIRLNYLEKERCLNIFY
ncbi:MAG: DUF6089 family protein [Lentimicrobium sp.]|nr:DUF6089 family protein [Lentimicrobium sp.]